MKDILRPILELSVVLPGLLLAYFPVKSYLKQSPGKLAARILPLMAGLCIGGGIVCYQLHASTASAKTGTGNHCQMCWGLHLLVSSVNCFVKFNWILYSNK